MFIVSSTPTAASQVQRTGMCLSSGVNEWKPEPSSGRFTTEHTENTEPND